MADLSLELQKAIVSALQGMTAPSKSGAGTIAVGVHDDMPQDAPLPCVSLSGQAVADDDTLDGEQTRHTIYLTVWSDYRGQRQVLHIMGEIKARLHNAHLDLDDGEAISCRVPNRVSTPEPDGITYQGAVTVEIIAAP